MWLLRRQIRHDKPLQLPLPGGVKGACANTRPISRKRIEQRVFGALRAAFAAPEMAARFEKALLAEHEKLAGRDLDQREARAKKKIRRIEAKRANLFCAIEQGMPYDLVKERLQNSEQELAAANEELAEVRRQKGQRDVPQDNPSVVYARIIGEMEALLGDPDLVDQAHGYLEMLIAPIMLTPDDDALHGLRAEFEARLGTLATGDGADSSSGSAMIRC